MGERREPHTGSRIFYTHTHACVLTFLAGLGMSGNPDRPSSRHTKGSPHASAPREEAHGALSQSAALLLLVQFVSCLVWPALSADLPAIDECEPKNCGDVHSLSYPFWIEGRQPPQCGYPAFRLSCKDDAAAPLIKIAGEEYAVARIFYNNQSFVVSSDDLSKSKCPVPSHNLSLVATPFSLNALDRNLFFFSGCSGRGPGRRIECPAGSGGDQYVVGNQSSSDREEAARSCGWSVSWPYLGDGGAEGVGDYAVLLKRGFLLNWNAVVNCSVCTGSGGRCRYDLLRESFSCACSDRLHAISCNGSSLPPNTSPNPSGSLQKAKEEGFNLTWTSGNNSWCRECISSGGACGYNSSAGTQVCFCSDKASARSCSSSSAKGVNKRRKIVIGLAAAVGGLFLAGVLSFLVCQRRRIGVRTGPSTLLFRTTSSVPHSQKDLCFKFSNHVVSAGNDISDVPLLDFKSVKAATSNFSDENKLGEGGFGPVYKGKLSGGDEVAVKRLSKLSKQGHQEFSNEVRLIAKLQHKNLVRLLGSCAHQDEKLLIYEYMPNKSLDKFIFDPRRSAELSWQKRFGIIEGIANGLLYLHHYSRMRVIHRDLKTSNILLDSEMNPKISDFGLARIFGADQKEANTGKVVGTFGYMSPEYASQGLFSEKSDVFSFGVILLEIITGERSTSFYPHKNSQTLLGYVWRMWEEGRALELLDPSMGSSPSQAAVGEVLKCTQLGLLCVQQDAAERPTMSYVVSSLSSETCVLPNPGQPAFANIGRDPNPVPSVSHHRASVNGLTLSSVGGR